MDARRPADVHHETPTEELTTMVQDQRSARPPEHKPSVHMTILVDLTQTEPVRQRADLLALEQLWPGSRVVLLVDDDPHDGTIASDAVSLLTRIAVEKSLVLDFTGRITAAQAWAVTLRGTIAERLAP